MGLQQTTLGMIADFINGGAWSQSEYSLQGVPVIRVSDIKDETVDLTECKFLPESIFDRYSKYVLRQGDLVVCTVGSHPTQPGSVVGRTAIMPSAANGALLNQNAVCIRAATPEVDQRWLGYLARSNQFRDYIISCARGSANQVRMAIGLLKQMPISLPPINVQRRIAVILSSYDELIENNTRRITILEEMARAIYREWLVKFRVPGHENAPLVDSPLGRIPEGWKVKPVDTLCQYIARGVTPTYEPGSGRFIINQKVNRGPLLAIEELKELRLGLEVPEDKFARFGDVLVNCLGEGTIGRVHFFAESHREWAVDQHMSICRSESINVSLYLYYVLSSPEGQAGITALKTGGTNMTMFNISALRSFMVVTPPDPVQSQFAEVVHPIIPFKQALVEGNRNLRRTRDLLLPRLISGELDVSELDIRIPEGVANQPDSTPTSSGQVLPENAERQSSRMVSATSASSQEVPSREVPTLVSEDAEVDGDTPPPIDQTDRSEVLQTIRQVFSDGEPRDRETAIREIARALGYRRVGNRIQDIIHTDLLTASRRGILENTGGQLRLFARSIDGYERDFLKQQFLAAIGRTWIDREEAIREFCRWMGFARTGQLIEDSARSLINGLLREDRIESDNENFIRRI